MTPTSFKTFGTKMLQSLHDLVTSKKFLAAVGTSIAAYNTDGDIRKAITGAGMAYIVAQGAADFGKESK